MRASSPSLVAANNQILKTGCCSCCRWPRPLACFDHDYVVGISSTNTMMNLPQMPITEHEIYSLGDGGKTEPSSFFRGRCECIDSNRDGAAQSSGSTPSRTYYTLLTRCNALHPLENNLTSMSSSRNQSLSPSVRLRRADIICLEPLRLLIHTLQLYTPSFPRHVEQ